MERDSEESLFSQENPFAAISSVDGSKRDLRLPTIRKQPDHRLSGTVLLGGSLPGASPKCRSLSVEDNASPTSILPKMPMASPKGLDERVNFTTDEPKHDRTKKKMGGMLLKAHRTGFLDRLMIDGESSESPTTEGSNGLLMPGSQKVLEEAKKEVEEVGGGPVSDDLDPGGGGPMTRKEKLGVSATMPMGRITYEDDRDEGEDTLAELTLDSSLPRPGLFKISNPSSRTTRSQSDGAFKGKRKTRISFIPPPSVRQSVAPPPPPLNQRKMGRDSAVSPPATSSRMLNFGSLMKSASESAIGRDKNVSTTPGIVKAQGLNSPLASDGEDDLKDATLKVGVKFARLHAPTRKIHTVQRTLSKQETSLLTDEHFKCHPMFEVFALSIQGVISMVSCWTLICYWFYHADKDRAGNVQVWRNNTLYFEDEYANTVLTHENFVHFWLFSYGLHLFSITLGLFVSLHNPRKNWGQSENLSAYFILVNRIIFLTPSISEGYLEGSISWKKTVARVFDVFGTIAVVFLIKKKRKEAGELSNSKLKRLVYNTLPKTIGATLVSLCFLFSESAGCLMRQQGVSLRCEDKIYSGATLSLVFVGVAFVSLCVLPFHPQEYTISNTVRFDFRFREQVQFILFTVGGLCALFIYASAQEMEDLVDWYDRSSANIGSESARNMMYGLTFVYLFLVMLSATFRDYSSEGRFDHLTGWMKAKMMTRLNTEMAPVLRFCFFFFQMVCAIPCFTFFAQVQNGVDLEVCMRLYMVALTAVPSTCALAVNSYMSRPKGNNLKLEIFMTGVSALSCFLTASGARSIDQPFGEMVLFGGFALFGFWHFKNCRAYLSMHSDEQISAHLNMCLKAFGTIVGPVVYLMAETIGCVSMFDSECELLFHCNFCVILHLVCGAVFFCLVGFTFAHQSWVDTLTFRNCDVNTFIRTIVVSLMTFLSLFVFGVRPKDSTYSYTSEEFEGDTTRIIAILRYVVGIIWMLLLIFYAYPLQLLINMEHHRRRSINDDHIEQGFFHRLWENMDQQFKKFVVADEESLTVSRAHKGAAVGFALIPIIGVIVGTGVHGGDIMLGTAIYSSLTVFLPASVFYTVIHAFLNLDDPVPLMSFGNIAAVLKSRIWRLTLIPAVTELVTIAVHIVLKGDSANKAIIYLIMFLGFSSAVMKERNRMIEVHPAKVRRQHLYGLVCVVATSNFPPLIFTCSEYIACIIRAYAMQRAGANPDGPLEAFGGPNGSGNMCDKLYYDTMPIMVCIVGGCLQRICSIEAGQQKTIENIVSLKFSKDVVVQVFIDNTLAVYAVMKYGMRSEGFSSPSDPSALVLYVIGTMVAICVPMISSALTLLNKNCSMCGSLHDHDYFADEHVHDVEYDSDDEFEMKERIFLDDDFASANANKRASAIRFGSLGSHRDQFKLSMKNLKSNSSLRNLQGINTPINKRFSEAIHDRNVGTSFEKSFWEGGMKGISKQQFRGFTPPRAKIKKVTAEDNEIHKDGIKRESSVGMNIGLI